MDCLFLGKPFGSQSRDSVQAVWCSVGECAAGILGQAVLVLVVSRCSGLLHRSITVDPLIESMEQVRILYLWRLSLTPDSLGTGLVLV